jgi:outer membrane lipoprotein-sorting protein
MRQIIAVCLLLSPLFSQQQLPDAKELLKQSGEAFMKYRSYQYELDMEFDIIMGGNPIHTEATSSVAVITPDKVRVEARGKTGGGTTVVADGEYTWTYVPLRMQYTRKAAMRSAQAMFGPPALGNPIDPSQTLGPSKTLRDESIEIDGKKYSCWVVETTADRVAHNAGTEMTNVVKTMWIDKDLRINRQITISGMVQGPQVPGSVEMKQKMVTRALKLDVELPDTLFRFTPPADTKEVADVAGLSPTPDLAEGRPAAPR